MNAYLSRTLIAVAFAAASIFAIERYVAVSAQQAEIQKLRESLNGAKHLAADHPGAFRNAATPAGRASMKSLFQDASNRHGITVAYISEAVRDAGDKIKERTVTARATNVPHAKLVALLSDLETLGGGARVKEIRVKPAAVGNGIYQEVESIVAFRWVEEKPRSEPRR